MSLGDLIRVMCPGDPVMVFSVADPEYGQVEEHFDGTVADLRSSASLQLKNSSVVFVSWFDDGLEICVEHQG